MLWITTMSPKSTVNNYIMRRFISVSFVLCLYLVCVCALTGEDTRMPPKAFIPDYVHADMLLPPGVPRVVDTNGNIIYVPEKFTSKAFQAEALNMVIDEANQVAKELNLLEELPITKTNLVDLVIGPFGFTYAFQKIGNITTKHYVYGVEQGYKFSLIVRATFSADTIVAESDR